TMPSPASTLKLPNGVTFNQKTAKCETVKTTAGPSTRCTQVTRLPLKDLTTAQRAERNRMMTELGKRQQQRASTAGSPAAIPAPPADCDFSGIEFDLTATLHPNRFLSCSDSVLTLTVIQITPFPEILGNFFWEDQQWATLSSKSLTWIHGLQVLGYSELAFGDLADGISGTMFSNCFPVTSNCTETSLGLPDPQSVTVIPGGTYNFGWDETDTGPASTMAGQIDTLNADLGVVWLTISGGQSTEFDDTGTLAVRCDTVAIRTKGGCVDQAFRPTLTYSSLTNPLVAPVAQHIYDDQNGGLVTAWGVPPSVNSNGAALTRDMNPADIAANRATACAGVPPSCDEYPMASTHQGAAFNSDFSAVTVPGTANSSQGGLTRAFYRGNRVIDGDPFYVLAILPNGTPSW
ncbi:MAG: NucA/NucB deoxyribonuclease domain-containing protein, partial [Trebonia sp.]